MAIAFRRCETGDLDLLLDRLDLWHRDQQLRLNVAASRRALGLLLGAPDRGTIWLILDGEQAVGYTMMAPRPRADAAPSLIMTGLYLEPDYRGRGIGQWAVHLMEALGRRLDLPVLSRPGDGATEDRHTPGLAEWRLGTTWRALEERKAVA